MNVYKKASLVAASVALTVSPVVASAAQSTNGVSAAAYSQARTSADATDANELEGGSSIIIALLAAAAIIAGIIIAADGSNNSPTSP